MSEEDQSLSADEAPWLVPHFRKHANELKNLRDITRLSVDGIYGIVESPRIIDAIIELERSRGIKSKTDDLLQIKESAELARKEVQRGFSVIYCNLMVSIWGQLEASTRTLVALWLENVDRSLKDERIQKLRIQLGEYEERRGPARFQYIASLLERDLGSTLKSGVDRFESLLGVINLSGPVPRALKQRLFELAQIRNCTVHNARVVDEQMLAACPWLDLELGSVLRPTEEHVRDVFRAVTDYSILIMARASAQLGKPMEHQISNVFREWNVDA